MYEWRNITADFDRSLPISKIRWNINNYGESLFSDGYFSELPNIDTDGKNWLSVIGAEWGYAGENRFSLYNNQFSNRYYGFTDEQWTAQTHTTQVDTNIYEFECPVTLYWSGLGDITDYPAAANKISVYVEVEDPIEPLLVPINKLYINGDRIN